jgi:hypothetical protein
LIKHRDKYASDKDITVSQPRSVLSKRLLADIARDNGGDVDKAATGDPQKITTAKVAKPGKSATNKKRAGQRK